MIAAGLCALWGGEYQKARTEEKSTRPCPSSLRLKLRVRVGLERRSARSREGYGRFMKPAEDQPREGDSRPNTLAR